MLVGCGAADTDSTATTTTSSSSIVPLESVECSGSTLLEWDDVPEEGDPTIPERFVGSNGEFVDACNGEGDLVQYTCEWLDCSNEWDWCAAYTGNVSSRIVLCDAACVAGACQ